MASATDFAFIGAGFRAHLTSSFLGCEKPFSSTVATGIDIQTADMPTEETKLLALTGDRVENPTMSLSARAVLGSGQKGHEVHGPFHEIEHLLIAPHRDFWRGNPRRRPFPEQAHSSPG